MLDVEYTNIKAPIDGQIGKSLVDVGNQVNASSTNLAKIVDSSFLYANFNPSAREVSLINKYKSKEKPIVKIKLENSNDDFELDGKIDFIDNTSNETTGTVFMRAKINNKDNLIFAGTFVEIKLNNIGQNQIGSFVYIVDENNKIQTKQITISYSNKDIAIIKDGLKQGDKVVVSNITKLRNNILVDATEISNPIKK